MDVKQHILIYDITKNIIRKNSTMAFYNVMNNYTC